MADIGNNDDLELIDDFVEEPIEEPGGDQQTDKSDTQPNEGNEGNEDDLITSLLKTRGIEDMSKIKFENEEGEIEELDWNSLDNSEKLNILNSSAPNSDIDLDDNEIELINSIRESGLTPSEYLDHLQEEGVNNYIQNNQNQEYEYQVDQYSDDELFIYDFISRMGDVTQEEAQEELDRAKSNETLFKKQINAIRNEYKAVEEENIRQAEIAEEERANEQYAQFASSIEDQINDFTEFSGFNLNLDDEDKDALYEFITGADAAGNNYFAKALSDPKILVQTAWFALNGKQMMEDITAYFKNEIKQVRHNSYQKGLADAKSKMNNSPVVFTSTQPGEHTEIYNDLDEI